MPHEAGSQPCPVVPLISPDYQSCAELLLFAMVQRCWKVLGWAWVGLGLGFGLWGWIGSGAELTRTENASIVVNLEYNELTDGFVGIWRLETRPLSETPKLPVPSVKLSKYSVVLGEGTPMAMVWDHVRDVLYVDLNRNLDMTDDPNGVFTNSLRGVGGPYYYGSFENVRLPVRRAGAEEPLLVRLDLISSGDQRPSIYHAAARVRSFWRGKVEIDGAEFEIGIIRKPTSGRDSPLFLLRAWDLGEKSLVLAEQTGTVFESTKELFYRGHLYELDHQLDTNSVPVGYRLQMREIQADSGEVSLTGKYLDRVVLSSSRRTVVLDKPSAVERIPVGSYTIRAVTLLNEKTRARVSSDLRNPELGLANVEVRSSGKSIFPLGGPLTNSVSIRRRGRTLVFDYELRGGGGARYSLIETDKTESAPPEFAVYRGEKKIASGKFEFG